MWLRVVAAIVNKCKSRRISFSLRLISLRLTCCALRLPFADVFDSIAEAVAVLTHCWPKRKRRCRFESESCEIHQWPKMKLGKPSWEKWETHVAHLRGNRQMRPSYNWAQSASPSTPPFRCSACAVHHVLRLYLCCLCRVKGYNTHTHVRARAKALRQGKYESKHILMAFQVYLHCPQEGGGEGGTAPA